MDVFGSTLSSKTNKMIVDVDKKFENEIKKHDDLISENREKIASLIITFENKFKLIDEKFDNLTTASDFRLHGIETNVDKLLTAMSTLERVIKDLTLRENYLDIATVEDSTIAATAQPITRSTNHGYQH
jgi:hypothetical protein